MSERIEALQAQEGTQEMLLYWATSFELPPFADIGSRVSYDGLLHRYETTSWGKFHMNQPPRFSTNFGYDYNEMLADLGEDVHPVQHMRVAHNNLVGYLLENLTLGESSLATEDICTGRLALMLHEVGESTHPDLELLCEGVAGDIPTGEKTADDVETETRVRAKIFETLYSDLPNWLTDRVIGLIQHEEESLIARLMEVAHNTTFIDTATNAKLIAYTVQAEQQGSQRQAQLQRLSDEVPLNLLSYKRSSLIESAQTSPIFKQKLVSYLGSLAIPTNFLTD